jgi:hypothetical protein
MERGIDPWPPTMVCACRIWSSRFGRQPAISTKHQCIEAAPFGNSGAYASFSARVVSSAPDISMTVCRICEAPDVSSLPIAIYAPFFRMRVDVEKDQFALYSASGGLRSYASTPVAKLKRAIAGASARIAKQSPPLFLRTYCNLCAHCLSLTPSHCYSYEDLAPLYVDYRSAAYNADRISVERSYRRIAPLVGQDPKEQKNRNDGVSKFLGSHLSLVGGKMALDLGGSDGKFIPRQVVDALDEIHIFDTSDAMVDESVRMRRVRKVDEPELGAYGLLMCMHVLEHVGSPREFVLDSLKYLEPNGFLYLEVPLELDPMTVKQFELRVVDRCVTIHEHVNQFDVMSLSRLIESISSLRLVKAEAATIDCGWSTGRVGRYLAQYIE